MNTAPPVCLPPRETAARRQKACFEGFFSTRTCTNFPESYTLKADGGAVADRGKFIVIWKNDGGSWKLHKDIFNTSQPAT